MTKRISFFKKCYPRSVNFRTLFFWKVVEYGDGSAHTMTVCENEITVDEDDDFEHGVDFIKNTLCEEDRGEYAQEISREEFDDEFKKIATLINSISKL